MLDAIIRLRGELVRAHLAEANGRTSAVSAVYGAGRELGPQGLTAPGRHGASR